MTNLNVFNYISKVSAGLILLLIIAVYCDGAPVQDTKEVAPIGVPVPSPQDAVPGANMDGNLPDMWCLSWHCSRTLYRCMSQKQCRQGLFCMQACGRNQECTVKCIYNYGNTEFENIMRCSVTENSCVELKAELPPQKCFNFHEEDTPDKSKNVVIEVPAMHSLLQGDWVVIGGRNQLHDCPACHRVSILFDTVEENKIHIETSFLYQESTNSTAEQQNEPIFIRHLKSGFVDPTNGVINLSYEHRGLKFHEDWRIFQNKDDSVDPKENARRLNIQYCGHLGAWEFEGELHLREDDSWEDVPVANLGDVKCRVNHSLCQPKRIEL